MFRQLESCNKPEDRQTKPVDDKHSHSYLRTSSIGAHNRKLMAGRTGHPDELFGISDKHIAFSSIRTQGTPCEATMAQKHDMLQFVSKSTLSVIKTHADALSHVCILGQAQWRSSRHAGKRVSEHVSDWVAFATLARIVARILMLALF